MRKLCLVLLLVAGCKSKLEKCNAVCEDLDKKHQSECRPDDASCKAVLADTLRSCRSICQMAVGEKPKPPNLKDDEKACDKSDAHACEELAEMYALGRGAPKDDAKAGTLFEKSCLLGNAVSCEFRGKMMRDGRGGPPDRIGAMAWLQKGCTAGAAGACTSLGLDAMEKGDKRAAVDLLDKACTGKDKLGCMGLAGLYLHGNGVRKDVPRAKLLLKQACDLGAKQACDKLATL
jgi:TPR repeat protein